MQKILLIDDDPAILDSYTSLLEINFDVESIDDINDAIEKLSSGKFSVAIIDMAFPDDPEGGLQICQYIQKNKIPTKAIIYTAFGSPDNKQRANKFNIHSYLQKGGRDSIDKLEFALFNATKEFLNNQNGNSNDNDGANNNTT